jgi:putative ABC transport system permease protein
MSEKTHKPPKFARWLFKRMSKYQENYAIVGDVEEVFLTIAKEESYLKACAWYWHQCLASLILYFLYLLKWRAVILKSYSTIAFRTYSRNKTITIVNILGLAIGMAAFAFLVLYISYERSYDSFHENSSNIYRLQYNYYEKGEHIRAMATSVPAIATALKENFAEVEDYARATRQFLEYAAFSYGTEVSFRANRIFIVTPSFLTMFDFPLLEGDPEEALSGPLKAVITDSMAKENFGADSPVGKVITYNNRYDFEITGVIQDVPANSHFKFDILLSYKSLAPIARLEDISDRGERDWRWAGFYTYIALKPGTDPQAFQEKIDLWLESERKEAWEKDHYRQEFLLQPLEDIHLFSNLAEEVVPNEQGDGNAVKVLSLIAIFILLLAWVNYINISTSRAMERSKEVGVRKVSGAYRKELVKQFFFEYVGILSFAAVLTVLIILELKSYFIQLTGADLSFRFLFLSPFWLDLTLVFFAGTFVAGIYPALILSSFKPVAILKGRLTKSSKGIRVRRFLVTSQLAISVALIAGAFIVLHQISFMLNGDLGIDIDQALVVHAPGMNMAPPPVFTNNLSAFRNEVNKHPRVLSVTTTTSVPGEEILWEKQIRRFEDHPSVAFPIKVVGIDSDFIPAFGVRLLAGRNFSESFTTDEQALILNEAAIRELGYENPLAAVNRKVNMWGSDWNIIGVLDYHQQSLKAAQIPIAYLLSGNRGFVVLKLNPQDLPETMAWISDEWDSHFPGIPYDYFFLDESFNRHYKNDRMFGKFIALFSGLTIFIACLGLFALASHNAAHRTKEIGIRKAHGASARNIYMLLSKEFLRLVMLASVVAIPFTYYQMKKWLENFAYRIDIQWWVFVAAWAIVSGIVLLTISYQSFKAAIANPVDSLRYE